MRKEFFNKRKPALDLYMVNCGYEDCCPNFCCAPHTRKYYLLHYVTKGEGFFDSGGKSYKVKAGDIFVIRPDEIVTYYSPNTDNPWSFCWVGFNGSFAEIYYKEAGLDEKTFVIELMNDEFLSVISNCLDYVESVKFDASQLLLNSYLISALSVICKKTRSDSERSKASHIVERAVRYIEFNYMNDISPSSLSEFFSLDRSYFYRIFKKATGSSPEKYIMNYRIKKAADFLKNSNYSVGEIAGFVGLDDIYYFSRLFKKIKGVPPSVYRNL